MPKHDPRKNHLLAALAEESYQRLLPELELIAMPLSWVLYESGMPQKYVYFPVSGIISLLYVTANGASSEIAMSSSSGSRRS